MKIRYEKEFHEEISADTHCGIILDRTNFYAEQGGQVNDIGFFGVGDEEVFTVDDCQVKAGYVMHYGRALNDLKVGDEVELVPDVAGHRASVMNNHTTTHILNHALRQALGTPADQKGSLVAYDRLRFDFVSGKALTIKQVTDTENICNEIIKADHQVYYELLSLEKAHGIIGLRAMFGETYPDPVRVVSVGTPVEELMKEGNEEGLKNGVEFCGGTHLHRSSHAKQLVITAEEAIAKGIRRIIAVTGDAAAKANKTADKIDTDFQVFKKETEDGLKNDKVKTISSSQKEIANYTRVIDAATIGYVKRDDLRKKVAALKKLVDSEDKKIKAEKQKQCIAQAEKISGELDQPFVVLRMDEACGNGKVLSQVLKIFQKQAPEAAVMLISCDNDNGRIAVSSQVPKSKVDKLKANKWVGEIQSCIDGKGGGKELNAMASGTNVKGAEEAIELAEKFAQCLL